MKFGAELFAGFGDLPDISEDIGFDDNEEAGEESEDDKAGDDKFGGDDQSGGDDSELVVVGSA